MLKFEVAVSTDILREGSGAVNVVVRNLLHSEVLATYTCEC